MDDRTPRPRWADVRAVVFDVGETLVDETRMWVQAAQEVGVPPLTLMAVLGALTERDEPHDHVWREVGVVRPATPSEVRPDDLYPDALPTLGALRAAGYVVAVAGNQPARAEHHCGPPASRWTCWRRRPAGAWPSRRRSSSRAS